MVSRFKISWVVEHGHPHYKIIDIVRGMEVHCDENELNETLNELMEAA